MNTQATNIQPQPNNSLTDASSDIFEAAADQFTLAIRRGDAPPIEEFAEKYPEAAEKIRLLFPMLAMMESPNRESMELPQISVSEPASSPERLGDFLIEREVGRGGMGIVYEATQESLGRRVALKVLPQRTLDATSVERFALEAKVVANLLHSNIVPVYGIGNHEGYSYYVMQFIQGQSLDRVLVDLRSLRNKPVSEQQQAISNSITLRGFLAADTNDGTNHLADEMVELQKDPSAVSKSWSDSGFSLSGNHYWMNVARVGIQVTSAVAYAHSRKILHRDIKPSNLIVDEAGSVFVTDFGLARSLESDRLTRTGEIVGTLRYMPPEQMAGSSDERSDVHGIGLTLYELLTLRPANDQADHRQLIAQVTEGIHKPPRKIDPSIPLDLETIVLKCIERDPAKRYQSADLLLKDLNSFAAGKPIAARRVGSTERVVKWAKRRPAVAGLALLAFLFASLGVAGVTWKWREANQNFHQSEGYFKKTLAAVNQLLNRVNEDDIFESPRLHNVHERLLQDALVFYEELARDESQNINIQPHRATALQQIGAIHSRLGQHKEAENALRESLEIFRQLLEDDKENVRLFLDACDTETHLAYEIKQRNNFKKAEESLTSVIRRLESRSKDVGQTDLQTAWQVLVASAYSMRASVHQTTKGSAQATSDLEASLNWFDKISPEEKSAESNRVHAETMVLLAVKLEKVNQLDRAAKLRSSAIKQLESVVEQSDSPVLQNQLANQRQAKNSLLAQQGKLAEAAKGLKAEHDARRKLIRDYPEFPGFQTDFARSLALLAGVENSLGNRTVAIKLGNEAVEVMQTVLDEHPKTQRFRIEYAYVKNSLGITHQMLGGKENFASAIKNFSAAHDTYKNLVRDYPNNPIIAYEYGQAARNLSHTLRITNPIDPKIGQLLTGAIATFESLVEREPTNTDYVYQLAFTRLTNGKYLSKNSTKAAILEYDKACEKLKRLIEMQPQSPRFRLQLTRGFSQRGDLQFQNGDEETWELSLRAAHQNMVETVSAVGASARLNEFLTISQNELGHCLKLRGHQQEAMQLFTDAFDLRSKMAEQHGLNDRFRGKLASSKANVGWMYSYWLEAEKQDLDKALILAQEASQLDEYHSSLLAYVHFRRGEFEQAYEIASQTPPEQTEVEAMGRLAICSLAMHGLENTEQAQAFLLDALKLRKSQAVEQNHRARHVDAENFGLVDRVVALLQD